MYETFAHLETDSLQRISVIDYLMDIGWHVPDYHSFCLVKFEFVLADWLHVGKSFAGRRLQLKSFNKLLLLSIFDNLRCDQSMKHEKNL